MSFDYNKYNKWQFRNFNSLCDKAKELIFVNLLSSRKEGVDFFEVYEIGDEELKLSPIEQIFLTAFRIYSLKQPMVLPEPELQYQIKCNEHNYVADFFLEYIYTSVWDDDAKLNVPTDVSLKKPIIIECDGYEFHKTKKQMSSDYERETNLKLDGYDIIRFTGSQIYNEPLECIKKVYDYVEKLIADKQYVED